MANCPKCGFENPDEALECMKCGVIFAKVKQQATDVSSSNKKAAKPKDKASTVRGFFALKAVCCGCDKEIGLTRYRVKQVPNGWLCPSCFKKCGGLAATYTKSFDLKTVTLEEIKAKLEENNNTEERYSSKGFAAVGAELADLKKAVSEELKTELAKIDDKEERPPQKNNDGSLALIDWRYVKKEMKLNKIIFPYKKFNYIDFKDVWYVGGVKSVDAWLKKTFKELQPRQIMMGAFKEKDVLAFEIKTIMITAGCIYLRDSQINKIKVVNSGKFIENMGALGQGIIGGLLFGETGALLGAAKGATDTLQNMGQDTWTMTIEHEGDDYGNAIAIEISPKKKAAVVNFLKHNYPDITEFDTEFEKTKSDDNSNPDDKLELLKKLKELKDQDVITDEEFQSKKKKILDELG